MMKKQFTVIALASALFLSSAGGAMAASAPKPIQVTLNGQALKFEVQPTSINSTTFVEFRSLFAALGYEIDYAAKTKTIHAVSDEHEIEMSLGADVAFVDGESVPVNGQLVAKDGRTLVGVRFIATLSGKSVNWDSSSRTVVIADKGPTAAEKAAVLDFLSRSEKVFNSATATSDDVLALVTSDSPLRDALVKSLAEEQSKSLQTKTSYHDASIEQYSSTEAVLYAVQDTAKTGGDDYFFDESTEVVFTLHPNAQGQWLLYDMEYLSTEYTADGSLIDKTVAVPDADKTAIDALLAKQLDALNKEDMAAYKATFASTDGLDDYFDEIQSGYDDYDQSFANEKTGIVYYNGSDKAVAIRSIIVEDLEDGYKTRFYEGNYLVKKDGKWLFDGSEYIFDIQTIEE
ncbi:copper amine oxidase N-terminal domain-containing protein [Cohnella sp. AR92]|uniref:copper amine oxidase N-terminal domain-containing protein n=1 Tax=Cohnella sp. AR92 TaxID=648716 RepID=UPI000F8F0079|nr:copper amine oxidase N-terminal domain-containing protein [Cohnella sp. AR92]RUS46724.1 copper amine oxidase N-terminal domain-containing protein [Cohnella sp. AR92]